MDPELPADRPDRPLSDEVYGAVPPAGRFGFRRRQLPSDEIVTATDALQRRLRTQRQANRIRRRWHLSVEKTPTRHNQNFIEDRYGIALRFTTSDIAQERFTASLPADRIEVFFT